jgi:hypothetical protein
MFVDWLGGWVRGSVMHIIYSIIVFITCNSNDQHISLTMSKLISGELHKMNRGGILPATSNNTSVTTM